MIRLAHLTTHPIQYHAPLFRRLAADTDFEFTALFQSDVSTRAHFDPGFGSEFQWDVPLLDGYKHRFLPSSGDGNISFWKPWTRGFGRALTGGKFDALWITAFMRPPFWAAIAAAKRRGIKVLVRDDVHDRTKHRGATKRAFKQVLFAAFRRVIDRFLAIGTLNRDYYLKLGVKPESIYMVPLAVDNKFFQMRAREASLRREQFRCELGLEKGRPVILYVGKIYDTKRPGDLLESYLRLRAAKEINPRPHLLFVGDGEQRAELESKANAVDHNSIRFVGFKNQTELPAYYDLSDVFVIPSQVESFGLVVNEAMNAGRPIISSDLVGCTPDLVLEGINGYVYRCGDVAALAGALHRVLADPARRRTMGEQSLRIINRWSFEEDVSGLRAALRMGESKSGSLVASRSSF